ncbi:MAG: hypothetical protein NW205_01840 [Hyphomicrobiaceae bacterium]|nr:hypothetical protein [Hyphomicrobiaceae bacterium]
MTALLQLYAGTRLSLAAYVQPIVGGRLFAPRWPEASPNRASGIVLLPSTEALQDRLHAINGTGEWLDGAVELTTTDAAFALRASRSGPIAYLEMVRDEEGAADLPALQSAILWADGLLRFGPAQLEIGQARHRQRTMWPMNAALRAIGVTAGDALDEATALGLYEAGETSSLMAFARPIRDG